MLQSWAHFAIKRGGVMFMVRGVRWLLGWDKSTVGASLIAEKTAGTAATTAGAVNPLQDFASVLDKQEKQLEGLNATFGEQLARLKQRRSGSPLPDVTAEMKQLEHERAPHTRHFLPKDSLETFLKEARETLAPLHKELVESDNALRDLLESKAVTADDVRVASEKLCNHGQHVAAELGYYINQIQRVMLSVETIKDIAGTALDLLGIFLPLPQPSTSDEELVDRVAETAFAGAEQVEKVFTLKVLTDLGRAKGNVDKALDVLRKSALQQHSTFAGVAGSTPGQQSDVLPRVHSSPGLTRNASA